VWSFPFREDAGDRDRVTEGTGQTLSRNRVSSKEGGGTKPSEGARAGQGAAALASDSKLATTAGHVAAVAVALAPFGYGLLRGSVQASLWLDEILYFNFERHPEVRAVEIGRPGALLPRLIGSYGYCDVQRLIHAAFDAAGFHLSANPELYLRLPSMTFFVLSVAALYSIGVRRSGDRLWAGGVALAFGSTPAFLFYAFEARVYSFAALLVILFLASVLAVLQGAKGWKVAVAAAVGFLAVWAHLWDVCLLAALAVFIPLVLWRDAEHWRKGVRVSLTVFFGAALALAEALYVFSIRAPGEQGFLLFEPQPLATVFWKTVYGPFLGLLRGEPEYVLGILLILCLLRTSGRWGWCVPAAVGLGLALSMVLMARFGFGVSPRHQTPLYAGIFASLALARSGWIGKGLLALLIGLNLVLLPATVDRVHEKGNGKQISEVIGSGERLRRFPVVVQHSYDLGYPDPLHTFVLAFYLDGVDPARAVTPILELPTHRDVREARMDRDYFDNGPARLAFFSQTPVEQWVEFLRAQPSSSLWLVTPAGVLDHQQARQYEIALRRAGFRKVRGIPEEFHGYPTTKLSLWTRGPGLQ
jgi:hypothetical protein